MNFENYKLHTIKEENLKKKLLTAERNMKKEMDRNKHSSIVDHGKPILYGDSILLLHIQRFKILKF
jgi:hypothetical protein